MTRLRGEGPHRGARQALPCALLACVLLSCGDSDGDAPPAEPDAGGAAAGRDAAPALDASATAGSGGGAGRAGSGMDAAAADAAPGDAAPVDAALADAAAPGMPEPVRYSADVKPIFDAKCVDCHHADNATTVDLTQPFDPEVGIVGRMNTWRSTSGPLIVEPGHPERSFLVEKIVGTDLDHEGSPMPWLLPRLTEEQIGVLEAWIEDGALDDDRYREEVVLIFGDGVSLGSRSGRCAFCHYEGGSLLPNLMNPFDPERGAVGVTGAYGRVLIEPGDPENSFLMEKVRDTPSLGRQMPLWHDPVTDDELATIERWIAEGALDN